MPGLTTGTYRAGIYSSLSKFMRINPDSFSGKLALNVFDKIVLGGIIGIAVFLVQREVDEAARIQAYESSLAQIETQAVLGKVASMDVCFSEVSSYLYKANSTGLPLTEGDKRGLTRSLGCLEGQLDVIGKMLGVPVDYSDTFNGIQGAYQGVQLEPDSIRKEAYDRFIEDYSQALTEFNAGLRKLARSEFLKLKEQQ